MASKHTLVISHEGYGECTYRLECENPDNCLDIYQEGEWPDANTCRCEDPNDGCREGDHGDCSEYGWFIDELSYACRCIPVDGCGYGDWLGELGPQMLGDWKPAREFRVPVTVEWDDGYPSLIAGGER